MKLLKKKKKKKGKYEITNKKKQINKRLRKSGCKNQKKKKKKKDLQCRLLDCAGADRDVGFFSQQSVCILNKEQKEKEKKIHHVFVYFFF